MNLVAVSGRKSTVLNRLADRDELRCWLRARKNASRKRFKAADDSDKEGLWEIW